MCLTQRAFAPKPAAQPGSCPGPATHIDVFAPVRLFGTDRTSNRPGWKTGNGRRQSVFLFGCCQTRLGANRTECLTEQLLGPVVSQQLGRRCGAVQSQPGYRP